VPAGGITTSCTPSHQAPRPATPAPFRLGPLFEELGESFGSGSGRRTALATRAEQDPDAAFRALLADPRLQLPATARALFEILGKNDPTQALQRLAQLPAVPWARDAHTGLATGWTQRDPKAAATAGLALPPGTRRVDFLQIAFSQWMRQDITAAKDWLMSLPPGESRARIITYDTVQYAQVHNAQGMAALLELAQATFPDYENITSESFDKWATQSPDDALQWALALPAGLDFTTKFLSTALEPFAADPDRVLSLLPQLKNPEARGRLVESTANAWAQRDPIGAWVWAAQLTDPSQRKAFEERLTFQWGELDAATAIPWLLKNQANRLGKVDSTAYREWAVATPDAAFSMLSQLPVENSDEKLVVNLLEGIAEAKPAIALSHLDLLKENQHRSSVIYTAMSAWSELDITAASAHTGGLPACHPGKTVRRPSGVFWVPPLRNHRKMP